MSSGIGVALRVVQAFVSLHEPVGDLGQLPDGGTLGEQFPAAEGENPLQGGRR